MWSPYKLCCKSGTAQSTVFGTANRCDWVNCTVQHIGQSVLKGNWGYTECVRCEYLYGDSRLLKQTANKECLSLLFVAVLFVRQCRCDVTLRCVRVTIFYWKSRKYYIFWVCSCSLKYPASNAHAPYCHLWPAPLCSIFPHYLTNSTIFEKKRVTEHKMCVLVLWTDCVWYIANYRKSSVRYNHKSSVRYNHKSSVRYNHISSVRYNHKRTPVFMYNTW